MSFKDKYLKYKGKDSSFKNLTGGAVAPVVPAPDNGFKPGLYRTTTNELVEKIDGQDIIMSLNFEDLCIWDPPRLYEGVHFSLNGEPWKNNNNDHETADMPITWAYVTLIRDVYLTVNNKKFKIKSGTPCDARTIQLSRRNISKIMFSTHLMEFVSESAPESACVVQ
jgi:hypothetical protein